MSTERELKLTVTEAEASRLADLLGPPHGVIHQRNHYLDTPERTLGLHGYGLRVREVDHGHTSLTLKGPPLPPAAPTDQVGLLERLEVAVDIDPGETDRILAGQRSLPGLPISIPRELLGAAGLRPLRPLGVLENERRLFRLRLPVAVVQLELDRTRFPDGSIECELEIEWPDPGAPFPETSLRELLDRAQVPWRPQAKSKLARLLERLSA